MAYQNSTQPNFDMTQWGAPQPPQGQGGFNMGSLTGASGLPAVDSSSLDMTGLSDALQTTPGLWESLQQLGGNLMGGALDKTNQKTRITDQGWLSPAISGATGLMNGWLGMQSLDLAKETFDFQKGAWNKNFAQQSKTLNTRMEDRQAARVSADPNAHAAVQDYMNKNRVG